jgi:hypothetical protein
VNDYLSSMLARQPGALKVAPNVTIYVNTHPEKLEENPLLRAKEIKSKQIFADATTGNVVARTGLQMEDGKITYASTRLKLVEGRISEVEMTFDDSPRVVASYVTSLDPIFTTIVPPEERMSGEQLKAVVERYFQGLTDHQPVAADYDERCDRYHSGQRVTNNARNSVEAGGPKNCFDANNGPRPWGPATNISVPLVDPVHGIVLGYTLLLYKNDNAPMYVCEIFKILNGKVRMIDNIAIKSPEMQAVRFPGLN